MLIGLTGFIGSGKNSVADVFVTQAGYVQDSFAAPLKDVCAAIFRWDRAMLEGDTDESREWRNAEDTWWAEHLGIPGFSPRMALQQVGTETLREHFNLDIWLLSLRNRYETRQRHQGTIVTDARFPNEIALLQEIGGILVHVAAERKPIWFDTARDAALGSMSALRTMRTIYSNVHKSEWEWLGVKPDLVIKNDGTLEELQRKAWDLHISLATAK